MDQSTGKTSSVSNQWLFHLFTEAWVQTIPKFDPDLTGLIEAVLLTLNGRLRWTQEKSCLDHKMLSQLSFVDNN